MYLHLSSFLYRNKTAKLSSVVCRSFTARYNGISEIIGRTPVVKIKKLVPDGTNVYAKLEMGNPGGSIKDRMAKFIIDAAENSGDLKPGQTVIEATSGNTGIGLAAICAERGYPCVMVMPESFSIERRKIMRAYGAKVILTPAHLAGTGMVDKATELSEKHGWFLACQFENEANAMAHEMTTGPEIVEAFADIGLDYFVTGYGTGGTVAGVGEYLRVHSPHTKIVLCEPDNSAMVFGGKPQTYYEDGRYVKHPDWRVHPIQGWTPNFIPELMQRAIDAGTVDEYELIDSFAAMHTTRQLAKKEGILTGLSGGATIHGAIKLLERPSVPAGSSILAMVPDHGERYMSSPVYEHIEEGMDEEEMEIARSTPFGIIGDTSPPPPPTPTPTPSKEPPRSPTAAASAAGGGGGRGGGLNWDVDDCNFSYDKIDAKINNQLGQQNGGDQRGAKEGTEAGPGGETGGRGAGGRGGEGEGAAAAAAAVDDTPAVSLEDLLLPAPKEADIAWVKAKIEQHQFISFSLKYCEFCWSLKKFLKAAGVSPFGLNLDDIKYREQDRGANYRAALERHTKCRTIPQVFVGGRFIGGCTDVFELYKAGELGPLLKEAGVEGHLKEGLDPYSYLPKWLHPR